MRLFYDLYSTRVRAEALLIGADCAAISIAIVYATAALHGGGSAWDIALVPFWASIPRAIARILGGFERPRAGYRVALAMASLGVLMAVLAVLGHRLIASVALPATLREPFLLAVLYFAWCSGILLCHAGAYRLHDVLLFSTLLLGLKESRPLSWVFVPLFLGAFFLSSAVRHLLLDVFPGRGDRHPWNLQNARAASLVAAVVVSAVFIAAAVALGPAGPAPLPPRSGQDMAQNDGPTGRANIDRDAADSPFILEETSAARAPSGSPRVGFSYRVGLRELAYARLDAREVLRLAPDPEDPRTGEWRPSGNTLWKGITLSSYDPGSESWLEESRLTRMDWPADGAVQVPGPLPDAPALLIRATVVTPVLKSIVQPYVTRRILSDEFTSYSMNSMGDIFPHPSIAKGNSYRVEVSPSGDLAVAGGAEKAGAGTDPRFLEVPPAGALGVDLGATARSIFRGDGRVESRVVALRAYFQQNGFRYSNRASWRGKDPVARFLGEERVGSCAYFATASTLLLRAGGVHARLAAGFLGGEWDDERGHAVLRNRDAHAWVEAFFPGAGWRPIDPTGWVPADESYRPPPDLPPPIADRLLDGGAAKRGPEWTEAALETQTDPLAPLLADPGKEYSWRTDAGQIALSSGREDDFSDELEMAAALESWIEYPTEEGQAIGLTLGGAAPGGMDGGAEEPARPGKPPAALRAPQPFRAIPRVEVLGPKLRAALIVLGGAVLALAAFTFLRPRRRARDVEDEEESLESPTEEHGAALPANGMLLDEADPRDRVLAEYLRLQASLERTRSHRRPHQTPVEHGRLMSRRRKALEAAFRELHSVLYRLVYGGDDIEERHAEAARKSCRRIRRYLT